MTDVINGVPRELLERIAKPVLLRSHEDTHADACAELRALLATAQPAADGERGAFEAFVVGFHRGCDLEGGIHDDPDYPALNRQWIYEDWDVQSAWAVWQACAALSAHKTGEEE